MADFRTWNATVLAAVSLTGPDDRRRARLEHAVLDLLDERSGSAAVECFARAA